MCVGLYNHIILKVESDYSALSGRCHEGTVRHGVRVRSKLWKVFLGVDLTVSGVSLVPVLGGRLLRKGVG